MVSTTAANRGTAVIVERVREAHALGRPLRIVGAATWLMAGRPVDARDQVVVGEDRGIVEYVPGDLTLTARAGTRLSEIAAATRAHGQRLPLDPWGGDDGTIGATLSTASAGTQSHALGLPRDVTLGVEFVTGAGAVVRAGGRVVKNVAGFDLTRLIVGSWGTLGVITEVTIRLRAEPETTRTLAIALPGSNKLLNELAARLRALPFTPLACESLNARLAAKLGLGDEGTVLMRLCGNEKSVRGQLAAARELGEVSREIVDESVWAALRTAELQGSNPTWRWSHAPGGFGDTWSSADRASRAAGDAWIHGSPMRGVVRVILPHVRVNDAELVRAASAFQGTTAFETLPVNAWSLISGTPIGDPVSRGIREKFDPGGVLNPGILGTIA